MICSKLPIPARVRSNLEALGCTGVVRGVCKGRVQQKVQGAAAGAQRTEWRLYPARGTGEWVEKDGELTRGGFCSCSSLGMTSGDVLRQRSSVGVEEDEEERDTSGKLQLNSMNQEVEEAAVDLEGSLVELRKHWNGGATTRWWWCLRERENRGTGERERRRRGGRRVRVMRGERERPVAGFIEGSRWERRGGMGEVATARL